MIDNSLYVSRYPAIMNKSDTQPRSSQWWDDRPLVQHAQHAAPPNDAS